MPLCVIEIIITFVDAHHDVLFILLILCVLCFSSNITMFVYNVVMFIYRPTVAYAGYFMYCSMCVAEYVVQLLNAVMEELMQPTPRTSGQAPPPLCSRSSRPEKQVAIDNHTTRFQQRLWRGWSQESHVVAVFTLEFLAYAIKDA